MTVKPGQYCPRCGMSLTDKRHEILPDGCRALTIHGSPARPDDADEAARIFRPVVTTH